MRLLLFALLIFPLCLGATAAARAQSYDLVIAGGRVIDPESQLDARRDVGLRNGRIVSISAEPLRGRRRIDATGLIVAPGFIDLHVHGMQLPAARMQVFDGVTTALELEAGALPVDRFYARIAAEGRPNNFGASVAWVLARYAVFNDLGEQELPIDLAEIFRKENWVNAVAAPGQQERIVQMVEAGLRDGGIGIGIVLAYAPGSGHKEFRDINALAARHSVPTFTHVRYASVLEPRSSFEAYQEIVATALETGAHMHIAHFNSTSLRDVEESAHLILNAQQRGLHITLEAYPYGVGSTLIGSAFFRGPQWQERLGGVRYEDFTAAGKVLDERSFLELQAQQPQSVITFRYLRPESDARDQRYLDISVLYPGAAIASDGGGWSVDNGASLEGNIWPLPERAFAHPRAAGTFSRFIRLYVRESGKLTLMQALAKTSLIPAQILQDSVPQMKNKGRVRVGADADLVIFDAQTITERATFEKPAVPSLGMRYVIVNGTPVIREGQLIPEALPGRPVRAPVFAR